MVTAKVTMSTSKQVRDYLLCSKCEQRFDRSGENYVLKQINHRGRFSLLGRLRVSPAIDFSLHEGIYSGAAIGLDTEKLAYFAVSVVWRSAIHAWRAPEGHPIYSAALGTYREAIRKYLL